MKQLFNNNNKKKKAFTLIELLVVIAIIGVLSGAVIVAMSGAQDSATDSRIKASMDQLRSSIEIYGLVNGANYIGLESDSEISLLIDDIESQVGTPTIKISGSGDRYCLSTNLKSSNELWCIDSAGFAGLGGCINYSCDRSLEGIPISTGLVGYWKMNEGTGSTAYDGSGNGNHGTLIGAPNWVDGALEFDGVDDYVNCGNDNSLKITGAITIGVWAKFSSHCNYATPIIDKIYIHAYNTAGYGLTDCGGFEFGDGTHNFEVSSGHSFNNGEWYHYVVTYDGNGTVKFYKNGEVKTKNVSAGPIISNTLSLLIGRRVGSSYKFLKGTLDEVMIYNRALSAEEITFLYNSSR